MTTQISPFVERRIALGLTLSDVQSRLSAHGFNYSIALIDAMEQGQRRFPVENPGFLLALADCLNWPLMSVRQIARRTLDSYRAERAFWKQAARLRPQNQFLLTLVLKYPDLTLIPGFNLWFELAKSIALQLPDEWFVRKHPER